MAFEGDLKHLELGDVLQTLAMTRQFGTLVIRGSAERRLAFTERGLALLSSRPSLGDRVGRLLVGRGQLAPEDLDAAHRLARRGRGDLVDEILVEEDAVEPDLLRSARRYVAQEEIFDLFRWREGAFEFLAGELDFEGPFADIWFDVAGVAMEAARRLDELPGVNAAVPAGEVFAPAEADAAPVQGEASDDLVRIYSLIDGSRAVEDVIEDFHLGAFDCRKLLVSLLERVAIRPAGLAEILAAAQSASTQDRRVRLLQRAVERAPAEMPAWLALADALSDAGRKRDAADALAELARLQHRSGEGSEALATLERALKLDRSNGVVHSHRTRVLFGLGNVAEALESARSAVTRCLREDEARAALDLAEEALTFEPNDRDLRHSCASALLALGRPDEAVTVLRQLAEALEVDAPGDSALVELYRTLARHAPDSSEWEAKIVALEERDVVRKRLLVRGAIAVAAVLILAVAAIPFVGGASVQDQIERAREMAAGGDEIAARELLATLESESKSEDEEMAINGLLFELSRTRGPDPSEPLREELFRRLEGHYRAAGDAVADRRPAATFTALRAAWNELSSEDARELGALREKALDEFRRELAKEAGLQLDGISAMCTELSARVTETATRLRDSDALERAELTVEARDIPELEELVEQAESVESLREDVAWDEAIAGLRWAVEEAEIVSRGRADGIVKLIEGIRSELEQVHEHGNRALAFVDRSRLLSDFKRANSSASDLSRAGRLEEAADELQRYLSFCELVRGRERGEVYKDVVQDYLESFPLEDLLNEQLNAIREIIEKERSADQALLAGDVARAFSLRCGLVRAHAAVSFTSRFDLPLSVTSSPTGAEIRVVTDTGSQIVGTTPATISYPPIGPSRIEIRLDGFEVSVDERLGATEDASSSLDVRLAKMPDWVSEPGARTEAAPAIGDDAAFVVDRAGVVRRIALDDGRELARFETGLLGGFVATPVLRGKRLHVAGVDGVGFVLDSETLAELDRYQLGGAVRTALLVTSSGVVLVDDGGSLRLVDDRGVSRWSVHVGTVLVDPVACSEGVAVVTLEGELVILGLSNGDERARVKLPGQPRWSAPVPHAGRLYVASESGVVSIVDPRRGVVTETLDTEQGIPGRPALLDGRIVVATAGAELLLRDLRGGEWLPAVVDANIDDGLVPGGDSQLAAVSADGAVRHLDRDGETLWRFSADEPIRARPVRAGGRLYLLTRSGRLIAISP